MTTSGEQATRFSLARFVADLLVTVAVLVAAALVIMSNWPRWDRIVLPEEPISIEGLATRGSQDAKVVLLEYADFQCPACAGFLRTTLPRFDRQYVEPGLVKIVFRHLPLPQHEFAWPAALAAECAGREGRFWEMHDLAFGNQRALTERSFLAWAVQLGLDASLFQACLGADDVRSRIEADMDSARDLHIASTPALIVGRAQPDGSVKLLEAVSASFGDLEPAVDRALAGAEGRPMTTVPLTYGAGIGGLAIAGAAWMWLHVRHRRRRPASTRSRAS